MAGTPSQAPCLHISRENVQPPAPSLGGLSWPGLPGDRAIDPGPPSFHVRGLSTVALSNQTEPATLSSTASSVGAKDFAGISKDITLPKIAIGSDTRPERYSRQPLIPNKQTIGRHSLRVVGNSSHDSILTITPMLPICKGRSPTSVTAIGNKARSRTRGKKSSRRSLPESSRTLKNSSFDIWSSQNSVDYGKHSLSKGNVSHMYHPPFSLNTGDIYKNVITEDHINTDVDNRSMILFSDCKSGRNAAGNMDGPKACKEIEGNRNIVTGRRNKINTGGFLSCKDIDTIKDKKTGRYKKTNVDDIESYKDIETIINKMTEENAQPNIHNYRLCKGIETSMQGRTRKDMESNADNVTLSKLTKSSTVILYKDSQDTFDDFEYHGGVCDSRGSEEASVDLPTKNSDCKAIQVADQSVSCASRGSHSLTNHVKSRYLDKPARMREMTETNRRAIAKRNKQLQDRMAKKCHQLKQKWLRLESEADCKIEEVELGAFDMKQSKTCANGSVVLRRIGQGIQERIKKNCQSYLNDYPNITIHNSSAQIYSASGMSGRNENPPNYNGHNNYDNTTLPNCYADYMTTDYDSSIELGENSCPYNSPIAGESLCSVNSFQNSNLKYRESLKTGEKYGNIKGNVQTSRKSSLSSKSQSNKQEEKTSLIPAKIDIGMLNSHSERVNYSSSEHKSRTGSQHPKGIRSANRMSSTSQSTNQGRGCGMTSRRPSQSCQLVVRGEPVRSRFRQTPSQDDLSDKTDRSLQDVWPFVCESCKVDLVSDLAVKLQENQANGVKKATLKCGHSDIGQCTICQKVNGWLQYFL